jgi:hypothetical protein
LLFSDGKNGGLAMKSYCDMLAALLIAGAALSPVAALTGCYATEDAYVVAEVPPPREEVVVTRPGYAWIHGHWTYTGGHWLWRRGHYERERPSQVYVEGHWERRGRGHVWVEGRWHMTVREHP